MLNFNFKWKVDPRQYSSAELCYLGTRVVGSAYRSIDKKDSPYATASRIVRGYKTTYHDDRDKAKREVERVTAEWVRKLNLEDKSEYAVVEIFEERGPILGNLSYTLKGRYRGPAGRYYLVPVGGYQS